MDWEIYFKNPMSQFDQFVDEEKTVIQANTEEEARAIMHGGLLGRFGYITEIHNVAAPEPVACCAAAAGRRPEMKGETG